MTLSSFQMKDGFPFESPGRKAKASPAQIAALAIEEFIEREEWRLSEIGAAIREAIKTTSHPMRMSLRCCPNMPAATLPESELVAAPPYLDREISFHLACS
ncbi:hypothetical protein [Rhizobium leguminosarum]|uniref:hypothetical protein n=1 Tax=Rhizobium leguminosarum TaxID=384 RepID=UPI001FDF4FB8|nr:hypothetical protein [Rhizobium leguminosarum]